MQTQTANCAYCECEMLARKMRQPNSTAQLEAIADATTIDRIYKFRLNKQRRLSNLDAYAIQRVTALYLYRCYLLTKRSPISRTKNCLFTRCVMIFLNCLLCTTKTIEEWCEWVHKSKSDFVINGFTKFRFCPWINEFFVQILSPSFGITSLEHLMNFFFSCVQKLTTTITLACGFGNMHQLRWQCNHNLLCEHNIYVRL